MLPQLDPTWYASQSVWMLITFCAMFIVIWRFVMPLMRATVDARQTRLESDIKATEALKAQAERLLKEYEDSMADVKKQSQDLIAKAQEEALATFKQTEDEFNARLAQHLADGEQKLQTTKAEAMQNIRQIASDLTVEMAQKVASVTLTTQEASERIDQIIKENDK